MMLQPVTRYQMLGHDGINCPPTLPNASKTWPVIKKQFYSHAVSTLQVNVTSHDRPHLGAPFGSAEYSDNFVTNKVNGWISEIKTLSSVTTVWCKILTVENFDESGLGKF